MGANFLEDLALSGASITLCVSPTQRMEQVVMSLTENTTDEVMENMMKIFKRGMIRPFHASAVIRIPIENNLITGIMYKDDVWFQIDPDLVAESYTTDPKTGEEVELDEDYVFCMFEELFEECPLFAVPANKFLID